LQTELHTTLLEQKSICEFLLRIKCLVDALSTCNDHVVPREHQDAILEGLPKDYGHVILLSKASLILFHFMKLRRYFLRISHG